MPLSPIIPNLAQLQEFRRSGRFDASLKPQKIDVLKSARIVGVRVGEQMIGFGTLEKPTPAEVARLKQDVCKSAVSSDGDQNAIFDDSPLLPQWSPQIQPIGVSQIVQKSAEVTPDPLEGIFPPCLRNS